MGRDLRDVLSFEKDLSVFRGDQAGDGLQGRGFACAVGSDQRDDFALVYLEGDSLDGRLSAGRRDGSDQFPSI
mgnify:CR=1 FL=1